MDNERFQARLAAWQAMPGYLEDATSLAQSYPSPLDAKLDAFCALYLDADAMQQGALAGLFACEPGSAATRLAAYARSDNLLSYIRRVARRLTSAKDEGLARLGLAAAVLAAEEADERDVLEACAFLKYAATQAGIELAPVIEGLTATARPQAQRILTALGLGNEATITRIVRYHEGTG